MTWHETTVLATDLLATLADIRLSSGTVTHCCPCADGVCITWTTSAH